MARDVAREAGIYEITHSWDAAVGDFNRDGWQDFILIRHAAAPGRIYRNDGGRFTEVNPGALPAETDPHDCAWGDANADGRPDAYCSQGGGDGWASQTGGTHLNPNRLLIQASDGAFVDQAASYGVEDAAGRGRWVSFIDVNHDRYLDLFVGNHCCRPDGLPSPNRLFMNVGGTSFRDAPEYGLNHEIGNGRCLQAADFNRDGWQDLLLCAPQGPGVRVYRNNAGTSFTDVTASVGLDGKRPTHALFVNLDATPRPELVQVYASRLIVSVRQNGRYATAFSRSLVGGREVATGDVNGDRHHDLYVLQGNRPGYAENLPDLMLLNNGYGTRFSETPIPQTREGRADTVSSIDYDRNGLTDFIVLNGRNLTKGPVQLVAFTP